MAVVEFLILNGTVADEAESAGARSAPVSVSGQCTVVINDCIAARGNNDRPRSPEMPNREANVTFAG